MPASVMLDASYPTSDEALRLCRILGNEYADALPPRLWSWGIKTDNEKGVFSADAKQLAQIVRFDGNPDLLLRAFLECDVIAPTGKPDEYRIRGWKRNARLFKERKRLRNLRRTQKRTRTKTRDERVENKLTPTPTSTKADPAPARVANDKPKEATTRQLAADAVPVAEALELYEHYQGEMERARSVPRVLMPPGTLVDQARLVLVNADRNMALAKRAVTGLVTSEGNKFWDSRNRALSLLHGPADFDQAVRAMPAPKGGKGARADRIADEDRRRKEREDREANEGREQWEAEHGKGVPHGRASQS